MTIKPAYSTPATTAAPKTPDMPKPARKPRCKRRGHAQSELAALRKRCVQQRKELEKLKAIVTVASTSDVENVIIVRQQPQE